MSEKLFVILLLVICFVVTGCYQSRKTDYSQYPFTDIIWTREGIHDVETIRFASNGDFSYYCACGNPVNDSDLCETYSYNEETKEIKLDCFETTDDTITTIRVIKYDDHNLELEFNGEIRKFVN